MSTFKTWFQNARPISLPQSMLPAITAVALSYGNEEFSWIAALAALVGVMFLHLGMNLLDDYFDYRVGSAEARKEVVGEGFRGRMTKYPYLTSGEATVKQLVKAIFCFLGIAAAMGVVVFAIRGWMILAWAVAALIIGASYSGGPLKLGFRGLGELVIFVMFGPLMMSGVYYSVTGVVDWKIWLLSTAVGLLVMNIVYSHSVLDAVPDKKMGKTTMAHLMGGKEGQMTLSTFVNVAPYLIVALGVVLGMLNIAFLTVVLVMPVSLWLVGSLRDFVNHKETPLEPKRWMGPMGDFDRIRKAGLDWFMLRWLTARNIVTMFCFVIIVVNFIVK